jgi:hypothetical protein
MQMVEREREIDLTQESTSLQVSVGFPGNKQNFPGKCTRLAPEKNENKILLFLKK